MFSREESEREFKARIWAEKIEDGFKFKLIFADYAGDKRPGSHTDYTLLILQSEIERIKTVIQANPEVLIKVFQRVFPNYDRSKGKLEMHKDNIYFEYNDPSQIDRLKRIIRWR
jgi:hypothetical protein